MKASLAFLAGFALIGNALAQEQVVEVRGQAGISGALATARQAAITDAVRVAVERVMGAYISASASVRANETTRNDTTESFEQFQQRVLKRADGFGRVLQILSETQDNGTYVVTVRVSVSQGPLEQELKAFLTRKGDPRIIVLIPEQILRRPVPDPAAETEITHALLASGYRLVDASQVRQLGARDRERAETLDPAALRDITARFGADLLVTGEAFAEELANPPAEVRAAGLQSYGSRLEVKVVDLATGQIIYSNAFHAGATGIGDALTGKSALTNAAKLAVNDLPKTILNWISGSGKGAARTFAVRLNDVPSFRTLTDFSATLRNAAGVRAVISRSFDRGGAVLEVEYDGSPEDLATLLEDLRVRVTGLSAGEITGQFDK
ncbi:flagellar assembly protein T N-terminal domain-containing protein [Deinococcus yavapaiensis]|uniref:Flagellar assembly T-like protein n=1 Tax=Deinococcus yavapaiensis KR-236 TaxID=694435 RepID=A0A318S4I0_9DEIO|nr:flagellar assembly protein T N-terminal domain-containing protein [Deinococcus yavapaiensis]PYE51968.1 flagellar assembly T-like protein [Deinococcus yavapaiensis KR-236]